MHYNPSLLASRIRIAVWYLWNVDSLMPIFWAAFHINCSRLCLLLLPALIAQYPTILGNKMIFTQHFTAVVAAISHGYTSNNSEFS